MRDLIALPKIDCHLHRVEPALFPYRAETAYVPAGQEIGTLAQMRAVFGALGVTKALLVQPTSGYGPENGVMLDAIARSGLSWRGMAVVGPETSLEALAALKQAGVVGVTYHLTAHPPGHYRGFAALAEKLAALDMIIDVQFAGEGVFEAWELLKDLPVRVAIDHCGVPDIAAGLTSPGFKALLNFATRPAETVIKLSGYHKFAPFPWPFEAAHGAVAALIGAFTPGRCVWGSDWPFLRVTERVDYAPLPVLMAKLVADDAALAQIFYHTAERFFWGG